MERKIFLLGDPQLYEISEECTRDEMPEILKIKGDLRDTLIAFRNKYGVGRAIAAPQIGERKRIIYRHLDTPILFINPWMEYPDDEMMEVLDDCMSFPGLLVKLMRHKRCIIHYKDENWNDCKLELEGDMSELLQHEFDHLDGILATMRAIDNKSFVIKENH
ncbi:peptide deformylase [Oxobacter pfennigii]|uniref:Peptide deformylase n=1 Tax=Oxobacter pfennigii TaxID=36849 RepID=A0A0P9AIW6_9CLOT|nr:peptide deformylase [Oxobacter pfennigii]KPU45390.1 peptide deformylase [Oxobacter pfennigii]